MSLSRIRDDWNALGDADAMWSILTDDDKAGNRWREEDFFATGVREIEHVMSDVEKFAPNLNRGRALDFGCGIGRLSQPLAQYFHEVVGVDIARSMIVRAEALNRKPDVCRYVLNETDNLRAFENDYFDLIYSNIVLQHMPVVHAKRYLIEFARVLRPGGLLMFQIPEPPPRSLPSMAISVVAFLLPYVPRPIVNAYRRLKYPKASAEFLLSLPPVFMDMHGMSRETVRKTVENANMVPVDVRHVGDTDGRWKSYRYVFSRR